MDAVVGSDEGFAARCLLRQARWATLATSANGQPFASLVTPTVAPDGTLLMLLSSMAEHSRHLAASARCAVMATGLPENLNWQTAPRITVSGEAAVVTAPALRAYWLARHPYARLYADFTDFSLWCLQPVRAVFIAGFGRVARLDAAAMTPPADAVAAMAAEAPTILAHCNGRHQEALSKLAQRAGDGGNWQLLGVDTDGFDLVQDESVIRLAFESPVADAAGALASMRRLVQAARHYW